MSITYPPEMLPKATGDAEVVVPSVEFNAHLVRTDAGWHIEFVFDDGTTLREDSYLFDTMEEADAVLRQWVLQKGGTWRGKQ